MEDRIKMIAEIKRHNMSQNGSEMGLFLVSRARQKVFSDRDRKLSHGFLCRCTISNEKTQKKQDYKKKRKKKRSNISHFYHTKHASRFGLLFVNKITKLFEI